MISFKEYLNEKGPGLWANIHKKRKSGRPMRKKGEKGAPTAKAMKTRACLIADNESATTLNPAMPNAIERDSFVSINAKKMAS